MNFLGVGPSELIFALILALVIMGPRDLQKTGRTIGRWLRQVTTSDGWKLFQQTSREIQTLPNRLMREAALDELKQVQNQLQELPVRAQSPVQAAEPGRQAEPAGVSPAPEPAADSLPETAEEVGNA